MKPRPIRFSPDPLDHAFIALDSTPDNFRPDFVALIHDEAPLNGCGLLFRDDPRLKVALQCVVKVGRMDPLLAKVVWKRQVLSGYALAGLEYLE